MTSTKGGFSGSALKKILAACLDQGVALKVAYSGGVDSHVLLHALCSARVPWPIAAIHIDHGLHPQSRQWARHCQQVCQKLDVSCTIEQLEIVDVRGAGVEATARRMRYARLAHHVGRADVLLTAHHLDDQAETVLLQLVRGSGVRGLAAMSEITPFAGGQLMRPLLGFAREQLLTYASSHNLKWIEDSSNKELHYNRNFVRHRALPLLEERWPQVRQALTRAAHHAAEASLLLDALAADDLQVAQAVDQAGLSVSALLRFLPERQRNMLRYWMRQKGFGAPSREQLQRILDIAQHPTRSSHATLTWPGAELHRYRDTLYVMAPLARPDPTLTVSWNPAEPLALPGTGYIIRTVQAVGEGLSRERIAGHMLTVRLRKGGETCRLPGRRHRHSLKKLLQEAGVPPWERLRLPLVFVNDELAAVADRWVCVPFDACANEPALKVVVERADHPA